jgi:hypothetical protein
MMEVMIMQMNNTTTKHLKTNKIGMFKELPRKKDITDSDYESITNKSYFLR